MSVIANKIPSERFDWQAKNKTFVAEVSELQGFSITGQLYDDACDQGFVMKSQWTGAELPFFLSETHKDGEGDIQFWEFKSAPETVRRYPKFADFRVKIFND